MKNLKYLIAFIITLSFVLMACYVKRGPNGEMKVTISHVAIAAATIFANASYPEGPVAPDTGGTGTGTGTSAIAKPFLAMTSRKIQTFNPGSSTPTSTSYTEFSYENEGYTQTMKTYANGTTQAGALQSTTVTTFDIPVSGQEWAPVKKSVSVDTEGQTTGTCVNTEYGTGDYRIEHSGKMSQDPERNYFFIDCISSGGNINKSFFRDINGIPFETINPVFGTEDKDYYGYIDRNPASYRMNPMLFDNVAVHYVTRTTKPFIEGDAISVFGFNDSNMIYKHTTDVSSNPMIRNNYGCSQTLGVWSCPNISNIHKVTTTSPSSTEVSRHVRTQNASNGDFSYSELYVYTYSTNGYELKHYYSTAGEATEASSLTWTKNVTFESGKRIQEVLVQGASTTTINFTYDSTGRITSKSVSYSTSPTNNSYKEAVWDDANNKLTITHYTGVATKDPTKIQTVKTITHQGWTNVPFLIQYTTPLKWLTWKNDPFRAMTGSAGDTAKQSSSNVIMDELIESSFF